MANSNVDVVRKFFDHVNSRSFGALKDVVHPDFVQRMREQELKGIEPLVLLLKKSFESFPDLKDNIEDIFASEHKVCVRGSRIGKLAKNMPMGKSQSPVGKEISTTWMNVFYVKNGKISERWINNDDLFFMQQMGVIPMFGPNTPGKQEEPGHRHGKDCGHAHGGLHGKDSGHAHGAPQQPPQPTAAAPAAALTAAPFPLALVDITHTWVEEALAQADALDKSLVRVAKVEMRPEMSKSAQGVPRVCRLALTYSLPKAAAQLGCPPRLLVHIHNPTAHGMFQQSRTGEREVIFFKHIATQLPPAASAGSRRTTHKLPAVQRCFFTECTPTGQHFLVLLEDGDPQGAVSMSAGITHQQAKVALGSLARLHAKFHDSKAPDHPALHTPSIPEMVTTKAFDLSWQLMKSHYPTALDDAQIAIGEAIKEKLGALYERDRGGVRTLCHGNISADVLFFPTDKTILLQDWQNTCVSHGMRDVAKLMGSLVEDGVRRQQWRALLEVYCRCLEDEGVEVQFDTCLREYAVWLCLSFAHAVVNGVGAMQLIRRKGDNMTDAERDDVACVQSELRRLFDSLAEADALAVLRGL